MSRPLHVTAAGRTDIGRVRANNEDHFAVDPAQGLFLVADGLSAYPAGEVASKLAVDAVRETFAGATAWPPEMKPIDPLSSLFLVAAIHRANWQIVELASEDPEKAGMGCTFAGALVREDEVLIAHVGDARAYRLRRGRLRPLTEDHAVLEHYVRCGLWSGRMAGLFPWPGAVLRALGLRSTVEVAWRRVAPKRGDVMLLATDGLTKALRDREIAGILRAHPDPEQMVSRLIDSANEHGGRDNVTCVAVRWD